MASPAARDPGPFVTFVLNRTVAKVLSMIRGAQVDPVLGRVHVELQQGVQVVDDLGDHFGVLRPEVDLERLNRDLSLVDILGVVDVPHRCQRSRVR
jgi:hypothetical protein